MARLRSFVAFWYDFVVGDDWRVATGVAVSFAATYAVSRSGVPAWWIVPLAVVGLLTFSVWRATRSGAPPP
jgi:hypothetical protein